MGRTPSDREDEDVGLFYEDRFDDDINYYQKDIEDDVEVELIDMENGTESEEYKLENVLEREEVEEADNINYDNCPYGRPLD